MKKKPVQKKQSGYDEAFKELMNNYFKRFADVITDFEILNLPKKVDILIIETKQPILKFVKIFT